MKNVVAVGLATVCLASVATDVGAADYGIGVSAKSNDAWIYAPIDITARFRLEPSIRFTSSKVDSSQSSSSFGLVSESVSHSKAHQREFGLGAFGLGALTDSLRLYYGVRAAYVDAENSSKNTFTTRFLASQFVDVDTSESKTSQDGYRVSPTLGFEYLINARFSIGGEAEWFYLDVDGDSRSSSSGATPREPATFNQKSNGTDTHLILRYRF